MSAEIPETFNEWRYRIKQKGQIKLTQKYIKQRLAILRVLDHGETQQFIRLYGDHHWQRVVSWFERALTLK